MKTHDANSHRARYKGWPEQSSLSQPKARCRMQLDGLDHITAITGDAREALEFYGGVLGLQLRLDSVSPADPGIRQLSFGGSAGGPGLVLLEYSGAVGGRPGIGMVHRIVWRAASPAAVGIWRRRLTAAGADVDLGPGGALRFQGPDGLGHELAGHAPSDLPPRGSSNGIRGAGASIELEGVRAYASLSSSDVRLMTGVLGARRCGASRFVVSGATRRGWVAFNKPPGLIGRRGAGTVHHVAWATPAAEHSGWLARLSTAGATNSGVVQHGSRRSLFFEGPDGVLFDLVSDRPDTHNLGVDGRRSKMPAPI
jgi:glyoxalase family protein